MSNRTKCFICDSELIVKPQVFSCIYCRFLEMGEYVCPNNHYICTQCISSSPAELIENVCTTSRDKDPVSIANLCMTHQTIRSRNSSFALIVPSSVLAGLQNQRLIPRAQSSINRSIELANNLDTSLFTAEIDYGVSNGAAVAIYLIIILINSSLSYAAIPSDEIHLHNDKTLRDEIKSAVSNDNNPNPESHPSSQSPHIPTAYVKDLTMKTAACTISALMKLYRKIHSKENRSDFESNVKDTDNMYMLCPYLCVYTAIKTSLSAAKYELKLEPKLRKIRCPFPRKYENCKLQSCPYYPK